MKRSALLYLLLVLAPAAVLAVLALGVADRDFEESRRRLGERVEEEAEALAGRVRGALADAAARGEARLAAARERIEAGEEPSFDAAVGFARRGEWLGFSPAAAADADAGAPPPDPTTARLYALSVRGGESFEHVHKDPARALDAYAFYLPRVREPMLRDRLRLRAARAALAAGRAPLAVAMLGALVAAPSAAVTEEGLPVALIAAALLGERAGEDGAAESAAVARRDLLRRLAPRLETARLAVFVETLAPDDAALRRALAAREALETAAAAHPEVALGSRNGALVSGDVSGGDALLLARDLGGGLRAVALEWAALPELAAGDLDVVLELARGGGAASTASAVEIAAGAAASRDVRLDAAGPVLATLRVADPRLGERLAELERRRTLQRLLVGCLVAVTLAGGVALIAFLWRERRLVALRERLLANVSHELKTPVTSIRMFSEMLAGDPYDPDRTRRFGGLLHSESLRLSRIIENVLDFSRLGREGLALEREPLDLRALAARVAESFAPRAREQAVEFRAPGPPADAAAGELVVLGDESALERILVNLLDNALKYRGAEGPEIGIAVERADGRARVSVRDNGVGIPARDRERVFDEFYRARYEDYAVQGSGLGLSIARGLARALGGDVVLAESREGEGSTFALELPLFEPDEPDGAAPAEEAPR